MTQGKLSRNEKIRVFSKAVQHRGTTLNYTPNEEEKRLLDELSERARLLDFVQRMNGSGYYTDKKFRQFIAEYNNRILNGHGDQQPSSFQILQDFVEPDDEALILKIGKEKFYSIPTTEILELITSPKQTELSRLSQVLSDGTVYHLNIFGGLDGILSLDGDNLALYGVAIVRRASELSIMALLGRFGEKPSEKDVPVQKENLHPDRDFLFPDSGTIDHTKDDLFDVSGAYPVVLLTRIDLQSKSSLMRYVLTERRDTFDVASDDRQLFTDLSVGPFALGPSKTSEVFDRSFRTLRDYAAVFAILPRIAHVLDGISERDDLKLVRSPTKLKIESSRTAVRKAKNKLPADEARFFVQVGALPEQRSPKAEYQIEGLSLKVEQKGYWRTLSPQQIGRGRNGEELHGRTWVTVNETWEESFGHSPPENSERVTIRPTQDTNSGEIYVMRSAMHPHDVYKVGYTLNSSSDRAKQLHRTSGQPDQFNVVESWPVKSPRIVEKRVHDALRQYRINSSREFFKLPYPRIRKEIEKAINELGASAVP